MEAQVGVGVAAIVRKKNRVLLAKRIGEHGKNTWGFPGGKLEHGEEIDACVTREVLEETGLKISNIKFGSITNDIFDSGKHFITVFMVCDWESGDPATTERDKMGEWKWYEWDKMPKPLFLPIVNLLKQNFNPF
jgi:8-oxo-dGTP diphosphatase